MSSINTTIALGRVLEEREDWSGAEQAYRQAIEQHVADAELYFRMGIVNLKLRKFVDAAECMARVVETKPLFAEAWSNRGVALASLGQTSAAEVAFRRAVELCPDRADMQRNLDRALQELGQLDASVANRAVPTGRKSLSPVSSENQGLAAKASSIAAGLIEAGKYTDAIANLATAIELCPGVAAYHNNLGVAYSRQPSLGEAVKSFRHAVQLDPMNADYYYNLAGAQFRMGDLAAAAESYRAALLHRPAYAEAHYNLGIVLDRQWKRDEALDCYRAATRLKPDFAEAHNNLGIALAVRSELDEAVESFHQALRYKQNYAEAYDNLATAFVQQKKLTEAIASYRNALRYKPDSQSALGGLLRQLQHACLWDDVLDLAQRAIDILENTHPNDPSERLAPFDVLALPIPTTAEQQRLSASNWVRRRLNFVASSSANPLFRRELRPKKRITIGYLSNDFRSHVLPYQIAGLFEHHDKTRFEVIGYSYGPNDESAIRQRIERSVERFVDLQRESFAEAAKRIAVDQVDILVDLTGYTGNARTEILISRPAPIQVNYLGFPGTMGATFIDYILVDEFVVPSDQQPFFSEQIVHLPGCYQVNDRQRAISERTPSRYECGLPEHGFVFCCLNSNYKITPQIFGLWMELLKELPGSVIWLLEGNALAAHNLRKEAEKRGLSSDRLVFAPQLPMPEHLARYRLADLFLDTFPVNAHTTASDALWVGCPVLTMAGQTFISRVAGSLLQAVGLPELVTYNLNDYQDLALELARNPQKLAELRSRLKANLARSSVFDPGEFAKNVERAYVTMWGNYRSGNPPRAFKVLAD